MKSKRVYQSKNEFYVCIRPRNEIGHDSGTGLTARWPKSGFGAFQGIEAAHAAYCEAIDEYGPEYRVVIEPVESENGFYHA